MSTQLSPQTSCLFDTSAGALSRDFNRRPFLLRHHAAGHPLFELPRLMQLARSLPEKDVEWNQGELPIGIDAASTPKNGLSPEETIRRIADCRSWLVLKLVERDPEFAQLLAGALGEIEPHVRDAWPGMCQPESFVFVTSPGSVTPYHMDPEFNVLLQVRGTKQVAVFDGNERAVLSHEELERFHSGAGRNLEWKEKYAAFAKVFTLGPGDALHIPVCFPHWVKNGPEVSVSWSVTFRTPWSIERDILYKINRRLRGLGVEPTPPGENPSLEAIKLGAFEAARSLKRWLAK